MNKVQNGILPASSTMPLSATINSRKASPLKIRPRPNLRGIVGLFLPMRTHSQARIGASTMIATEFTDWNHDTGKSLVPATALKNPTKPILRSTILSARKLNELPACSKNIQNSTLKTKIVSIAITLSRGTVPSRTPSRYNMTAGITKSAIRMYCRIVASIVSNA